MDEITLRHYAETDHDWLVDRHAALYAQNDGFDASFGRLVSEILSEFEASHDPRCERGWVAMQGTRRVGSIFCVSLDADTAKLLLFLVEPDLRGTGLGRRLLETCMQFAKASGHRRMQLWTHESHKAACALYRKTGWQLTGAKPVHSFGRDLVEQSWEITL